jgi:hypothetical protein
MLKYASLILLVFLLPSCSSGPAETRPEPPGKDTLVTAIRPQGKPEETVRSFLVWYRDNAMRLAKIPMVRNAAFKKGDTTKYYRVDFAATEKYLAEMKASGFISEKYLYQWRAYFKNCDEDFKKNPEYDGPPAGFDYDFVSFAQEDIGLDEMEKVKVVEQQVSSGEARLTLEFKWKNKLAFVLSNVHGKWLIDDIKDKSGK